tara:strand:- start:502 stop:1722 length:1221 start_codon:yes stop_codon:yes gene_type:complete
MKIKYPLAQETINKADIDELTKWLQTYPRLTQGEVTKQFEEKWAKFVGTKYSVFCNSGSSANLLMVNAIKSAFPSKFRYNKKAVVPATGWVTTISPIIQAGLEPIMVDSDPDTLGIDLDQLEALCQKGAPALVIFAQVLGVPHHRKRLLELKEKYGFLLLEDACAALGSEYRDDLDSPKRVGTVGDASSFSFYFGHQLSTIEGGMVNTDDFEIYQRLLMLRSHGWGKDLSQEYRDRLLEKYELDDFHDPFTFFDMGYNLRGTDLQSFIGIRQVEKAVHHSNLRCQNHIAYGENLKGHVTYQNWGRNFPASISFAAFAENSEQRKQIVQALAENGIETRLFTAANLGLHPFWTDRFSKFTGKVSTKAYETGFFLPNCPEMAIEDVDFISQVVVDSVTSVDLYQKMGL